MNKRLEEKLAMLAFGDMSPEEIARLESEVSTDREASSVLNEYRDIRSGLKALADVPEHQLSTERMRHAILNQGLKPKSRPQLGWLWMPTMAACLAFGFVVVRNLNRSSLTPPSGGSVAIVGNPSSPDMVDRGRDAFALATASAEILSVDHSNDHRPVTLARNDATSRQHRPSAFEIASMKAEVMREFENQMMADNVGPNVLTSAPNSSDSRSALDKNPDAKRQGSALSRKQNSQIVLIDADRDSSTGAQKATEVDSASNVVVGG